MNETHFKRFVMILRSAGFVDRSLIRSQNALNFAYIVYLHLRAEGVPAPQIESWVRRWFVLSILTRRYSGAPEAAFDRDIRNIAEVGFEAHLRAVQAAELSDAFWEFGLPQQLNTSSSAHPAFGVFLAPQVKMKDKGFLSRDILVHDLVVHKGDLHHIFPRNYLKSRGFTRAKYNQLANYVMTQSEINIAIGDRAPREYFEEILAQCNGGGLRYGGITRKEELEENLRMNCIPLDLDLLTTERYEEFLDRRRRLMAEKVRTYYFTL